MIRTLRTAAVLFSALAVTASPAMSATVVGSVCGSGGNPLRNAQVAAQDPAGKTVASATADPQGHFLMQGLNPGVYILQATPPVTTAGIKPDRVSAAVGRNGLTVDWRMSQARSLATAAPRVNASNCSLGGAGAAGGAAGDSALETATAIGLAGTLAAGGIVGGIAAAGGFDGGSNGGTVTLSGGGSVSSASR